MVIIKLFENHSGNKTHKEWYLIAIEFVGGQLCPGSTLHQWYYLILVYVNFLLGQYIPHKMEDISQKSCHYQTYFMNLLLGRWDLLLGRGVDQFLIVLSVNFIHDNQISRFRFRLTESKYWFRCTLAVPWVHN